MMCRALLLIIFLTGALYNLSAQENPAPAPEQKNGIKLVGGTAHLGNGTVIENSVIKFENGKITFVGKAGESIPDDNTQLINVSGKHIYPGIIAPNTTIGITEIDAIRATRDYNEVGDLNPNVRSIIAYNTDSRIIPTVRSNGILIAEITPQGGTIPGSSSMVELDGWNWEDAAYKTDIAIHINWPSQLQRSGWWGEPGETKKNEKYDEIVNGLYDFFREAKAYAVEENHAETNLRFEAMDGLFSKEKKLLVHVNEASEIMSAIDFKKYFGVDMAIVGGKDSWRVADMLKANNIPVILSSLHDLPLRTEDDVNMSFKIPFLLQQAGVEFCLATEGSWGQRNLIFMAGTAAAYGLSKEDALKAITFSAAKILGLQTALGTIEMGKDATLIISTGDILDMKSSNVELAFIRGKEINLDNKQKALYRRYKAKYER